MEENAKFDKKSLKYVLGKSANFGELAKDCVVGKDGSDNGQE